MELGSRMAYIEQFINVGNHTTLQKFCDLKVLFWKEYYFYHVWLGAPFPFIGEMYPPPGFAFWRSWILPSHLQSFSKEDAVKKRRNWDHRRKRVSKCIYCSSIVCFLHFLVVFLNVQTLGDRTFGNTFLHLLLVVGEELYW